MRVAEEEVNEEGCYCASGGGRLRYVIHRVPRKGSVHTVGIDYVLRKHTLAQIGSVHTASIDYVLRKHTLAQMVQFKLLA